MKSFLVVLAFVAAVSAQTGVPDLSTMQGVQQFLTMEQIPASSIISSNCVTNGNACSTSGGQPCCLSPVFSCQANPKAGGANQCMVVPAHVPHIPQIKQIMRTYGITTENPVL